MSGWNYLREYPFSKLKAMGYIEEIPLGKIYASPMPYSAFDVKGSLIEQYIENGVEKVIVLSQKMEVFSRTGLNLFKIYRESGLEVINFPIEDHTAPPLETAREFAKLVRETKEEIERGTVFAVHCHAGMGRTGLFLSALTIAFTGMNPDEATDFTLNNLMAAPENSDQLRYLEEVSSLL